MKTISASLARIPRFAVHVPILLIVGFFSRSVVYGGDSEPDGLGQGLPASYTMTAEDLELTTRAADGGDLDAIVRLQNFYDFGPVYEPEKAIHWMRIAALKGHRMSMYNLGVSLIESKDEAKRSEAVAWLSYLNATGNKDAGHLLELYHANLPRPNLKKTDKTSDSGGQKTQTAEPGATNNPDDTQRIREDP